MLLGTDDTTLIIVQLIGGVFATIGLCVTGWFSLWAAREARANAGKLDRLGNDNSMQHGQVATIVRRIEHKLDSVHVIVGAVVSAQRLPVFRSAPSGELIDANPAALVLLGASFQELTSGSGWLNLIHPDDRARVATHWANTLADNREQPPIRYRYVHPATKAVTEVDAVISPLKDDGAVREWVSVVVPVHRPDLAGLRAEVTHPGAASA